MTDDQQVFCSCGKELTIQEVVNDGYTCARCKEPPKVDEGKRAFATEMLSSREPAQEFPVEDRTYDKDECDDDGEQEDSEYQAWLKGKESVEECDHLDEIGRVVFIGPVSPSCDVKLFSSRPITNVEVTRLIVLLSTMIQNEMFDSGCVTEPAPLKDLSDEDLGVSVPHEDISSLTPGEEQSYSEFVKARKARSQTRPK